MLASKTWSANRRSGFLLTSHEFRSPTFLQRKQTQKHRHAAFWSRAFATARDELSTVLRQLADAYREKYNGEWDFDNDDEVFDPNGTRAHVFRVAPTKVIAFAKSPHGQTTFRF